MGTKIQITVDCADVTEVTDRSWSLPQKEAAIAAKVATLVALGATDLETIHEGGGTFTVLRDPEQNEFCVQ
jgi:hypothetical protein